MGASGQGTNVQLGQLRGHEQDVRQLAGQLDQAVGAAGSAQALGSEAFGLVGQVVALPVQGWISAATDALRQVADAGHKVAQAVNDTHTSYSDTEDANARSFSEGS
jgi:uncharacterized protein YukE